MTTEQAGLAAAGVVAITALVLALLAHRRARHAEAAVDGLVERLALLERPPADTDESAATAPAGGAAGAYVITGLGDVPAAARAQAATAQAPTASAIDGRLFADIVARETVVKAASWTHGLRRALSAEARNRIRFEVRQETRRTARERRAEMKQALREFRARERAAARHGVRDAVGEDVA